MAAVGDTALFDASEVAIRRMSLTKLCTEIARSVSRLGRVSVEGEVVKPVKRPSGWMYFTLADRAVKIQVSCPAQRARRCSAAEHGTRVAVTGTVSFMSRNGQLHLEAEEVVPVGAGAIEAQIARTRELLRQEGVLDRPRHPIPLLPTAIGVLCGAEAAVIGDIESVVAERFPGYPLVFRKVTVSGPGAVDAIVGALRHLASVPEVEVVIVARGGGDPATLFPFSDEEVCRVIAQMPVPVVTSIGHERDHPLCDEVSDLACSTPSLAAIRVVPDEAALRSEAERIVEGARDVLVSRCGQASQELGHIDLMGSLASMVNHASDRLAWIDIGLPVRSRLERASEGLESAARTLDALDPTRVLRRGFAVVRSGRGEVVRSPGQLTSGDELEVEVAEGIFPAVVA